MRRTGCELFSQKIWGRWCALMTFAPVQFMASGPATTQNIACHYEIAATISGPYCAPYGYPPTIGTGISPSGRYVCGYYNVCTVGQAKAFLYDTQTHVFTTLPFAANGFTSAYDVNEDY